MGQVTDDIILEAVIMDGTPSRTYIYDYVARFVGDMPRAQLVTKAGHNLRGLVKYRFLREIIVDGQRFYCFPDCKHPAPIPDKNYNMKGQIIAYIESLPKGSRFTAKEIHAQFGCSIKTVQDAIRQAKRGYTQNKVNDPKTYIKGASA